MSDLQRKIAEVKANYDELSKRMEKLRTDLENHGRLLLGLRIHNLKENGYSNAEIAKTVGLSENSVRLILKAKP
jgi:hypothetical protein